MAITITIPAQYTTDGEKLRYLWNLDEKVLQQHNYMGTWYRDGATQNQYNNLLCNLLKNRYPYTGANVPKLTEDNFKDFVAFYRRVIQELREQVHILQQSARNDATINASLDSNVSGS